MKPRTAQYSYRTSCDAPPPRSLDCAGVLCYTGVSKEINLTQEMDDYLSKLNKKTRQLFIKASEIHDDIIPTASFGINLALGGGIRRGHQCTFWGNESGGKSALWLQSIAINQRLGYKCAYIDAERTLDPVWARRLGVDIDNLDVARTNSIKDFADAGVDLIKSGVDLIVVDSTSAMLADMYFDEHGDIKTFEETRQLGRFAADFGKAANMHLSQNWSTAIVHISQLRKEVGQQKAPDIPTGGKQMRHLDSLRIKLTSSASDSYAIKEAVPYGDKLIEENVGRPVTWLINKNKFTGKMTSGDYDLYTARGREGVDKLSELVLYGKKYGIIEGTTWLTLYGEKIQGTAKTIRYLRDNQEVADKLEQDIYGVAE